MIIVGGASGVSAREVVTGVFVTETVPANTTFNPSGSTEGWECLPNNGPGATCTLALGAVAAGAGATVNFAVNINNPIPAGVTQIDNTASIEGEGGIEADPNPEDNTSSETTPVNAAPDLRITKDAGAGFILAGGTLTYVLAYTNVGNQGATGVIITETVPANTTFTLAAALKAGNARRITDQGPPALWL